MQLGCEGCIVNDLDLLVPLGLAMLQAEINSLSAKLAAETRQRQELETEVSSTCLGLTLSHTRTGRLMTSSGSCRRAVP